jgi:hypothetical protein
MFIALPPFTSEATAVLVTLFAALAFIRLRRNTEPHDAERAMRDLTTKVREKGNHPYTYPLFRLDRYMRGE